MLVQYLIMKSLAPQSRSDRDPHLNSTSVSPTSSALEESQYQVAIIAASAQSFRGSRKKLVMRKRKTVTLFAAVRNWRRGPDIEFELLFPNVGGSRGGAAARPKCLTTNRTCRMSTRILAGLNCALLAMLALGLELVSANTRRVGY